MNDNIKVRIDFLISVTTIISFVIFIFTENIIFLVFIAIMGVLARFIYSVVMEEDLCEPDLKPVEAPKAATGDGLQNVNTGFTASTKNHAGTDMIESYLLEKEGIQQ